MSIRRIESGARMSQAVVANGIAYLAGQVASDTAADVEGQTRQVLAEIDRLLALAGSDKSKAVSANIWLADMRLREAMNEAWNAWTGGKNVPTRATVEAKLADPRMLVEIALVAAK